MSSRERYELTVPGCRKALPLVESLIEHGALAAGLAPPEARAAAAAVREAVEIIERELAKNRDEGLPVTVATSFDDTDFRVEILERGQPMAKGGAASDPTERAIGHAFLGQLFDTIDWQQIVPVGSELRLHRKIHRKTAGTLPTVVSHPLHADEALSEVVPAPAQEYEIRRFQERDALAIARSIYQAYGHTYLDPDLYNPARINELNRSGRLRSVVAQDRDGNIVGHYALERPDPERSAEAGQAVVDHAHRGRHILEKMHVALSDWAREIGLPGFFGRATARHAATQKMNARFGAVPVGLFLAYSPASMRLRNDPAAGSGDRPSSVLYWTTLRAAEPMPCYLPAQLVHLADPIFESLGFTDLRAEHGQIPEDEPLPGEPAIQSQISLSRGLASLLVAKVSRASAAALAQCCADVLTMQEIVSIVLHLPLDDAATPWLAEFALTDLGFKLAGVLPFDLPGDRHGLILERTRAQIDTGGLELESEIARNLLAASGTKEKT